MYSLSRPRSRRWTRVRKSSARLLASGTRPSELSIQRQVQEEHVDAWLAEEAERARFDLRLDQLLDAPRGHAAAFGHARDLPAGRRRREVRIQARGRGGDQIARHRTGRVRVLL